MRVPRLRQLRSARPSPADYAFSWVFLAGVAIGEVVLIMLSQRQAAELLRLASTNVTNLTHDPIAVIAASAYLPEASLLAWLVLIPLALFGANRTVGNWRIALICAAGHVIGTLVSEGIQAYRVAHDMLPHSAGSIIDVGPSYVVISAVVVAVLFGSWPARIAALADLAILVFIGQIFSGLTRLDVAAVGHVTAIAVAVVLGGLLAPAWRHSPAGSPIQAPAAQPATSPAAQPATDPPGQLATDPPT
jgi:hypothetical protein